MIRNLANDEEWTKLHLMMRKWKLFYSASFCRMIKIRACFIKIAFYLSMRKCICKRQEKNVYLLRTLKALIKHRKLLLQLNRNHHETLSWLLMKKSVGENMWSLMYSTNEEEKRASKVNLCWFSWFLGCWEKTNRFMFWRWWCTPLPAHHRRFASHTTGKHPAQSLSISHYLPAEIHGRGPIIASIFFKQW